MAANRFDLIAREGESLGPFPLTFRDPGGAPVSLTACTFSGGAARAFAADAPVVPFVVAAPDPASGDATWTVPALPVGRYRYTLYLTWADGRSEVIAAGAISIWPGQRTTLPSA